MLLINQSVSSYSIGKSRFLAKKVKEAIDQNINPWQSDAIKELLMVRHIVM